VSGLQVQHPGAEELGVVVQQIVTRLLPDGSADMRSVAELLGVTTRTLQRRLSAEGLTFVAVVARARLDVARRMLDDPARKVIDVALDLGYSDPAHFTRAFARWTGLAPREFRRRERRGAPAPPDRPSGCSSRRPRRAEVHPGHQRREHEGRAVNRPPRAPWRVQ
jgi:AraC-like DNA-binding protein